MSTELLHAPLQAPLMGPTSGYIKENRQAMLEYEVAELAALRFSIMLTARWESCHDQDTEQRAELRTDLSLLRRYYGNKLDDIAITFGVNEAIKAKDDIERTVMVPHDMIPLPIQHEKEVSSEWGEEAGYGL